jgi:hypothetical protein
MRLFVAVMFLTLLPVILLAAYTPPPSSEGSWKSVAFYDPNPAHIWNRLAETLLVREGPLGTKYGADSLDPLLWRGTKHLLEARSHKRAINVLDEFLQTHAENLIRDLVKRAVLQRDLWAVFDWSVREIPRMRQSMVIRRSAKNSRFGWQKGCGGCR